METYDPPHSEFFWDDEAWAVPPVLSRGALAHADAPQGWPSPRDEAAPEEQDPESAEHDAPEEDASQETVEAVLRTSAGNPVAGVEATLRLEDGAVLKETTNDGGVAVFEVPAGVGGTLHYEDEDMVLLHSVAADLVAGARSGDEALVAALLQAAVDLGAVRDVVEQVHGEDLGALVQGKFGSGEKALAFDYLLLREGLIAPSGVTLG